MKTNIILFQFFLLILLLAGFTPSAGALNLEWRYYDRYDDNIGSAGSVRLLEDGRVRAIFQDRFIEFPSDQGIPSAILKIVPEGSPPAGRSWAPYQLQGTRENPESSRYSVVAIRNSIRAEGRIAIFDWEEKDVLPVPAVPDNAFVDESLYLPASQLFIVRLGGRLLGMDPRTAEVLWNISLEGRMLDYPALVAVDGAQAVYHAVESPDFVVLGREGIVKKVPSVGASSMAWDAVGRRFAVLQQTPKTGGSNVVLYNDALLQMAAIPVADGDRVVAFLDNGTLLLVAGRTGVSSYDATLPIPRLLWSNRTVATSTQDYWSRPVFPSRTTANVMMLDALSHTLLWWNAREGLLLSQDEVPADPFDVFHNQPYWFDPTHGREAQFSNGSLQMFSVRGTGVSPPRDLPGGPCFADGNFAFAPLDHIAVPEQHMGNLSLRAYRVENSVDHSYASSASFTISSVEPMEGKGQVTLLRPGQVEQEEQWRVMVAPDGKNLQELSCRVFWQRPEPAHPIPDTGIAGFEALVALAGLGFAAFVRRFR